MDYPASKITLGPNPNPNPNYRPNSLTLPLTLYLLLSIFFAMDILVRKKNWLPAAMGGHMGYKLTRWPVPSLPMKDPRGPLYFASWAVIFVFVDTCLPWMMSTFK
jgi:hypothetical protein